jgi:hypothetical protein
VHFEKFQGLLDEISKVVSLSLTVVNLITHIQIFSLEQIHDWENLSVIWNKSLTDGIRACDQGLQNLKSNGNNFSVSGVQSSFDWNNQLWNDWKNLGSTLFKHIENTLDSEESVWINLFSNALKENWEIMMVVELLNINFPIDFILRSMLNSYWKISSVVEKSEFTYWNLSAVYSTSSWLKWNWFWFWLI